jgi:formylglycine-generating enzyme required for sulfatase activity/tRNA A-37 threonylcarbamoyl transferase component Bud32
VSELEPGSIFGRDFRIVKALRAGGMGAVYVAFQISTGKERALKVMAPELASDPATRERFVLEAQAAGRIESDHVVEIVTAGVDEASGAPYIVMELLKGEELGDYIARVRLLPLGDVAEILQQIGHALEQAHHQGLVHRDLKLENIFLCASRRRDVAFTAKVLDFGIAKLVAENHQTGTQPLGTPLFMAPEQTDRRGRICPATDVWALGLIAFRLLTGQYFWIDVETITMLLRQICIDPIPFASERGRELHVAQALPPGFDAWFARCVNRDIDARFQDAGEAVRAFAELVTEGAPRGVLVMSGAGARAGAGGSSSSGVVAASGPLPDGPPAPVPLELAATGAVAGVATVAVTGAPLVARTDAAALAKKPGSSKGWILGVVAAALGVGVVALTLGRSHDDPSKAAMTTTPTASGSAVAPPIAPPAKTKCPEGSVLIPGGSMFMGARDLNDDAKPPHEVVITSFCLDRTEVTTRAYGACVEKGMCERALEQVSWPGVKAEAKKRYSPLCNAGKPDRGEHPVNCVAWPMADNYCKKSGGRLPTEAEWEYAARGSSQRKFPWGDDPPSARLLNACGKECALWGDKHAEKHSTMYDEDDGFSATAPVGSFPAGAAAHGVMDLAGNVWEWTADYYAPYSDGKQQDPKGPASGDRRVVRGGDYFAFHADWARPAYRWKTEPESYNHAIGFRCAADPG